MKTACIVALALTSSATPAAAVVGSEARAATSSSIPCDGKLRESLTSGGNFNTFTAALTLTCTKGGRVSWILQATSGCFQGEGYDPAKKGYCDGPAGEPARRFVESVQGEVHSYALAKYAFGKDCSAVEVLHRNLRVKSDIIERSTLERALACRVVSVVDGTKPGGNDTYVSITTRGPPFVGAGDDVVPLVGVLEGEYDTTASRR